MDAWRKTVVISYRSADADTAALLNERLSLEIGPDRVVGHHHSPPERNSIPSAPKEAIGSSLALLVVIGPGWLTAMKWNGQRCLDDPRDAVRTEIEAALHAGVPVIPVLAPAAHMPAYRDLPMSLWPLVRWSAIDLSSRRPEDDIRALSGRLIPGAGSPAVRDPSAAIHPDRPRHLSHPRDTDPWLARPAGLATERAPGDEEPNDAGPGPSETTAPTLAEIPAERTPGETASGDTDLLAPAEAVSPGDTDRSSPGVALGETDLGDPGLVPAETASTGLATPRETAPAESALAAPADAGLTAPAETAPWQVVTPAKDVVTPAKDMAADPVPPHQPTRPASSHLWADQVPPHPPTRAVPSHPPADAVPHQPPAEVVRHGPGVPPTAPAGQAGLTAERVWRTSQTATPPRTPRRLHRLLGSALTVILLAASGVVLYLRFHHPPFHVTGVAIVRHTHTACGVRVIGRISTNGAAGTVAYEWVITPGRQPPQRKNWSAIAGQHAAKVTADFGLSGQGRASETFTLQVLGPDPRTASTTVVIRCR
jgi:hypothetical protein